MASAELNPSPARTQVWHAGVILALIAAVIVPHYMLPATHDNMAWHEVHRHLLYAPILLAALWYNWRGGLLVALIVSLAYFPHLLMPDPTASEMHAHMHHPGMTRAEANPLSATYLLAMGTYLAVGGGVGFLFGRLQRVNTRLAEQSRQLKTAMEQLTEQTRAMLAAEEQLRRADRLSALGQLTSGLAHEIRNPLAAVRGAAEILGDAQLPDERRREFSQVVVEETNRLDHVLGEFLDYARARKREETPEAHAAITPVVDRVLKLLARPLEKQKIAVTFDVPENLAPVALDAGPLQQVVLNLALNAVQAMPDGGALRVCGRSVDQDRVEIELADTGAGIPAAAAEKIFDPFYSTKPQGSGLGLSVVHKIVTGAGGTIEFVPNLPRGARFLVRLPRA